MYAFSIAFAFTGYDTVSSFAGKEKISAFKLMQKNRKYQRAFTLPGKEWSVLRDLSSVLQEFTCNFMLPDAQTLP